ncbi:MAG: glycosyltransferase family 4 protein [Flavobacteriales bacterium]
MKVIFLTQYFPPEVGAPQNRISATARALQGLGAEVTVLTAMPNYPEMRVHEGYRGKWKMKEQVDGLSVIRAWILVSAKRGVFWRLCTYFSFVFSALVVGLFNLRRSDVLFVESPPLFLGITAMWLAKAKGARLVFNVSDLWPESAVQLGLVTNRTMIALSTRLEMRCYRKAALITGQTQGIVADIQRRCPDKRVFWLPNGVDFDAVAGSEQQPSSDPLARLAIAPGAMVLAYAGILGHAQGLEVVLHAARQLSGRTDIHFLLIGDGPEKTMLRALKAQLQLGNVHFVERMPRTELLTLLRAVDGVVVPLRRNDLFKGAIPSKIFEALALAKPLLLGVEGEAKELFIDHGKAGIAFIPEDAGSLSEAVVRLADDRVAAHAMGESGLRYVREHFDRQRINARFWEELRRVVLARVER